MRLKCEVEDRRGFRVTDENLLFSLVNSSMSLEDCARWLRTYFGAHKVYVGADHVAVHHRAVAGRNNMGNRTAIITVDKAVMRDDADDRAAVQEAISGVES